jgi:hypothetical protein
MVFPSFDMRRLLLAIVLSCLAVSSGCDRGPTVVQVKGKVLYTDGTVPKAGVRTVRFEPKSAGPGGIRQAAVGSISSDGSFEMCRRKLGDGVFPGEYAVTFTIWKAPRERVSLIDEKYTNSASTPYHVTIDKDVDDLLFEIEPLPGVSGASPAAESPEGN